MVDFQDVTRRQQAMWASGDFHVIGRGVMAVSEDVCEAVDPRPGQRVLDVACGSGNAALIAARRFCEVTGIDYVPALVERARQRAAAEGVEVRFELCDAQALPFPDAHFDVVLSVFGVMFAPDQERAGRELLRVCRPGGRIGVASWMPEGYGGDLLAVHARHHPPPPGVPSPTRWGTETGVREILTGVAAVAFERRTVRQHFLSLDHAVATFATHFGPTRRALERLDPTAQAALLADLRTHFQRYDRARDGTTALHCEYLLAVAER
jgi:SAM-dependent methyltransferase